MKKYVIMIEYSNGNDKGCDGFRPDTKPILNSFKNVANIEGEVVFYNPKRKDELFEYIKNKATIIISRINPGNLKEVDEYFVFLKSLSDVGININTHPDVMINLDFKDILEKLKNSLVGDNFNHDKSSEIYFKGKSGFVGCRYLPRIIEGEIRALLVGGKIASIVHKKPANGEFSATLFSGATYEYHNPTNQKYKKVVELTLNALADIKKYLNGQNYPLLWTMDYILDYDKKGNDKFVLSEINCSCVGITTQLDLADEVAKVFIDDKK